MSADDSPALLGFAENAQASCQRMLAALKVLHPTDPFDHDVYTAVFTELCRLKAALLAYEDR